MGRKMCYDLETNTRKIKSNIDIYIGGTLIRFEHVIEHIIGPLIHLLREQIHEKLNQI